MTRLFIVVNSFISPIGPISPIGLINDDVNLESAPVSFLSSRKHLEGLMLLTIATTHRPGADLGYLLHKHPDRCQSFDLSFGKARVFYPEVGDLGCSACLLLDVDPVGMVRGKSAS